MKGSRFGRAAFLAAAAVFSVQLEAGAGQVPVQVPGEGSAQGADQTVIGEYEGWFKNANGSSSLLVGYVNRTDQEFDIPVGPNNRIEPGRPDRGQPTHFQPGRRYGIFTIPIPEDFRTSTLTWTLVLNGQTNAIRMRLDPNRLLEPFGNTPPILKFDAEGARGTMTGPPRDVAMWLRATVGSPLMLTVWASDDGAPVVPAPDRGEILCDLIARDEPDEFYSPQQLSITWSKFRGPGAVVFRSAKPPVERVDGRATTTVTFDTPGEYILRVQANDSSGDGGGGSECCWTNAYFGVVVVPNQSEWWRSTGQ